MMELWDDRAVQVVKNTGDRVDGADRVPQRIRLSRLKGFKLPADAVVVSRPSIFGNPFVPKPMPRSGGNRAWRRKEEENRRQTCVDLFREHLLTDQREQWVRMRAELARLRGKDLACWCPLPAPGKPDVCHAAVLLEEANR